MNLRTVGKIGFLLVIIGFFMPVACDQSGFELAKYFIERDIIIGILMYLLFLSAIIGVILGVLLLQNKEVNKGLEWFCLTVCVVCGLIVYFTQLEGGPKLQSGAYMILTGWIVTFIFQIIPYSSSKNNSTISISKKCRQCENIYIDSSSCPKCGSSFYEEVKNIVTIDKINNISPTIRDYNDTWVCKKCNERNPNTSSSCKGCGEYK